MTRIPHLALMAGLGALLAGCANQPTSSTGAAPAPAPAARSGPAAAPPPPAERAPQGMTYDALKNAFSAGNTARVKKDLVGQLVTLDLARAAGRGAPAGTYTADGADRTYFRCRATAPGFSGGTVTTTVVDYRFVAKGAQRTIDLARCGAPAPESPRAAPAAAAAAAPAAAATAEPATSSAGKPGMDARGNVIDSSKVEAGSGRTVKGLNDFEGEITGNPAANSKFSRLQIGMSVKQVTDLAGSPTDQGAYITGKAWIPFYFGSDRHRFEMTYKGQGRLIFAGGGMGDFSSGNLIWIIHSANEKGYR